MPDQRRKQKPLPPIRVEGIAYVKRYQLGNGSVRLVYPSADNPRKKVSYRDAKKAAEEGAKIARELHNGGRETIIFDPADRASYSQAKLDVERYGVAVHVATAEWAQAKAAIGQSSLSDIIAAGVRAVTRSKHPVPDVVAELLRSKTPKELHGRYMRGLRSTGEALSTAFPCDIAEVTPGQIEAFLVGLEKEPRRRDNILDETRHIFRFAWKRGYLASELTAARRVEPLAVAAAPISYFTPAEIRELLEHVSEPWLPHFLFACFSGVRPEGITEGKDIRRGRDFLRWEDIDWDDREIDVRKEVSKTYPHRCPILPNLWESLKPWRDRKRTGRVCEGTRHDREIERIMKVINRGRMKDWKARVAHTAGSYFPGLEPEDEPAPEPLRWKNDGLRHSYGSYRMAVLKDMGKVAYEMGNSEQMIKENYNNPRAARDAREYFAICLDPTPKNVLFLPGMKHATASVAQG